MSDGDSGAGKSAGIPAWQLSAKPTSDQEKQDPPSVEKEEQTEEAQAASETGTVQQSTQDVVEQGKRFLLDSSIRDAPLEQKRSFLEAQGLTKADIDKAVELSRTAAPSVESPKSQTNLSQRSLPPTPPPQTQRDVPPIITYPEFLLHSTKPAPIITANRLLTTAYTAAGISALLYGCNKYLITPLLASLTDARHDFATHSHAKITELNTKLGAIVSHPNPSHSSAMNEEQHEDTALDTSDPTELFHRDYGTQTAPSLTHDDDASSTSSNTPTSDIDSTTSSAQKLHSILHAGKLLSGNEIHDSSDDQNTLTVLRLLHEYLESLAYPGYSGAGVYGAGQVGGYGVTGGAEKKEEDEVARFRNEIRSVKGGLLAARNFPGAGASGRGRGAGGVSLRGARGGDRTGPRESLFPAEERRMDG